MRRRLFFVIDLDKRTKNAVEAAVTEIEEKLGYEAVKRGKFVPRENWHITVLFLGSVDDTELPRVIDAGLASAKHFAPKDISFDGFSYGPSSRMIWLRTDAGTSKKLADLKAFLEDQLESRGVPFQKERRPVTGHVTIARFPGGAADVPSAPVERGFRLRFESQSMNLMESELSRSGAEYDVLQEFSLSGEK